MRARVHPSVDAPRLAALLRQRQPVTDDAFDALLSVEARARSRHFWSAIRALQHAADFFREAGATRVLDVGSGVGKSACVLSLDLARRVCAVEQRGALAQESVRLAERLGADVEVIAGPLADLDPSRFDGFYCFNPFAEHAAEAADCFDLTIERSFEAYLRDARCVERWLRAAPVGTALVTFNGLGGRIPTSYVVRRAELVNDDQLRLWVKERADDSTDAWLEVEALLVRASTLEQLASGPGSSFSDSHLIRALAAPLPR
jgi:SAM-dependent methyltransferase